MEKLPLILEDKVSFCTTALARPEIINQTYQSFSENIENLDFFKCKLYINIDPIPNDKKLQQGVLEVAKSYFSDVFVRMPAKANFTCALSWCWSSADTPYIFQLEDDWILLKKMDFNKISNLFDDNIKIVILTAYTHFEYTGVALSPSIWKRELYKAFVNSFDKKVNPEHQLKYMFRNTFSKNNVLVIDNKIIVKDIGREWSKKHNLKKPKEKARFIKY